MSGSAVFFREAIDIQSPLIDLRVDFIAKDFEDLPERAILTDVSHVEVVILHGFGIAKHVADVLHLGFNAFSEFGLKMTASSLHA